MSKCKNRRCNKEINEQFAYCPFCGKPQVQSAPKTKKRPNGAGTVYLKKGRKTHPYAAVASRNGQRVYIGYYATRSEALNALIEYANNPVTKLNITVEQLHAEWKDVTYRSLGKSVQQNYDAAWIKLQPIYKRKFRDLRTAEMQAIIDYYDSPHHEVGNGGRLKYLDEDGKGTYRVTDKPKVSDGLKYSALHKIKCLLTSMYTYALQNDIVNKNYAEFIKLPARNDTNRSRFTDLQLERLKRAVGVIPYADYIYALCYLNFRVSEFLELNSSCFRVTDTGIPLLIGGKKTEAGTDRIVPIHPNIVSIVQERLSQNGDTLFCDTQGKAMTPDHFRKQCFYPALNALGFPSDLTPHSCRRTFSTRMSAAGARPEDIIALMGHTDFSVDIDHYINQETQTLYQAILRLA